MSGHPKLDGFEFRQVLGQGGFSVVYLYDQLRPRRPVAVKLMHAEGLSEDGIEQFEVEADVMAALSAHPSIVTIYSSGIAPDGRPFLVMEFYPGSNLRVRARRAPLPVADVLRIGVQVAAAVETAHRGGILHRDIKPANILTSQYGRAGLTDFGISVRATDESQLVGMSLPWAPPEAFSDDGVLDARSDVYSLGATLYTLLSGASPFERKDPATTDEQLIDQIRHHAVPPTGRWDVPPLLERLLAVTMSKSPTTRPRSALELARALQELEIGMRLQPTSIDVLDDVARAAHELSPAAGSPLAETMTIKRAFAHDIETSHPISPPVNETPSVEAASQFVDPGGTAVERTIIGHLPVAQDLLGTGWVEPTPAGTHRAARSEAPHGSSAIAAVPHARAATPKHRKLKVGKFTAVFAAMVGMAVVGLLVSFNSAGSNPEGETPVVSAGETPSGDQPSPGLSPSTALPTPVYSVRVDPTFKSTKDTTTFSDTLRFTLAACAAQRAGSSGKEFAATIESARLFTGTKGSWKRVAVEPVISTPGDCAGGQTQVAFDLTADAPDEAATGKGWLPYAQYLIQFRPTNGAERVNLPFMVSTRIEDGTTS